MCRHFAGYSPTSGGDKTKKKLSRVPLYALLQADKFTPKHNIDIYRCILHYIQSKFRLFISSTNLCHHLSLAGTMIGVTMCSNFSSNFSVLASHKHFLRGTDEIWKGSRFRPSNSSGFHKIHYVYSSINRT